MERPGRRRCSRRPSGARRNLRVAVSLAGCQGRICDEWRTRLVDEVRVCYYSRLRGGVAEWSKAADCKSAGQSPTVVRIHPPPPFFSSSGSNSVVESRPSKPLVAGSIPVSRSILNPEPRSRGDYRPPGLPAGAVGSIAGSWGCGDGGNLRDSRCALRRPPERPSRVGGMVKEFGALQA